jgi:RNA polymerase sigma-70 factor (ECF subfamily)
MGVIGEPPAWRVRDVYTRRTHPALSVDRRVNHLNRVLPSDTERLLDQVRAGDRESLDALFRRHRGRLLAFIRTRMSDALAGRVAPEDLLQETHLEALRKRDEFRPRGATSFYRWLVSIACFKIAEAERARHAKKRSLETPLRVEPLASQTSPSGRAMRAERAMLLRDALARLSDDQAEAVRLRYLEGLSLAETADRLGRSAAAVKALVSRGLQALADRIRTPG